MLVGPPRGLGHCCACDREFLEYARRVLVPNRDYLVRGSHRREIRYYPNLVSALIVKLADIIGDIIPPREWGHCEDTKKMKMKKKVMKTRKDEKCKGLPHRCLIREESRVFFVRRSSAGIAGGLLRTGGGVGAGCFTGCCLARDSLAALEDLAT